MDNKKQWTNAKTQDSHGQYRNKLSETIAQQTGRNKSSPPCLNQYKSEYNFYQSWVLRPLYHKQAKSAFQLPVPFQTVQQLANIELKTCKNSRCHLATVDKLARIFGRKHTSWRGSFNSAKYLAALQIRQVSTRSILFGVI